MKRHGTNILGLVGLGIADRDLVQGAGLRRLEGGDLERPPASASEFLRTMAHVHLHVAHMYAHEMGPTLLGRIAPALAGHHATRAVVLLAESASLRGAS